jgi:hypothetical protein
MGLLLGLAALILLVWGVLVLIKGALWLGIVMIVLALVLGAGFGVFSRRNRL